MKMMDPDDNSTSPENQCRLQSLPAELRNEIFALVLKEDRPLAVCTDDHIRTSDGASRNMKIFYALVPPQEAKAAFYEKYASDENVGVTGFWLLWREKLEKRPAVPALALTCRQFFREAMAIFYEVNEFVLSEIYSRRWDEAWFQVSRRLAVGSSTMMMMMRTKHVRIHVWNCGNECVPATEDAGVVHLTQDLQSNELGLRLEGMFEGYCFCELHKFVSEMRGKDCVETFVKSFRERWYNEVANFERCGCLLPSRCDDCGGIEWETWETYCRRTGREHWLNTPEVVISQSPRPVETETKETLRQADIRDYFGKSARQEDR